MTAHHAAYLAATLLALAVSIDSLEVLVRHRDLGPGRLYDYAILRTGHRFLVRGRLATALGFLLTYPTVLSLPALELLASAGIVAAFLQRGPTGALLAGLSCLLILLARSLFYLRQQVGLDGADQMMTTVSLGLAGAFLLPDGLARRIALSYIALQLVLSYATAGLAKGSSPLWRSGAALPAILLTQSYGSPQAARLLSRHPLVSRALCWWVILFECSAPVLISTGTTGAQCLVVMGLAFHVGVAILMGLNVFVWAFAAAMPPVLFLGDSIGAFWQS